MKLPQFALFVSLLILLTSVTQASDSLAIKSPGKHWKFAVRLAGEYDTQQGEDESILRSGIGLNLQLMYPLSQSFAVIANYGRSGLRAVELPQYYNDESFTAYASDLKYSSYRYSLGIRFATRSLFGWGSMRLILDLTAGKLHRVFDGNVLLEDSTGQAGYRRRPNWKDPNLLFEWETGLQLRLSSNIAAEAGVRRFIEIWNLPGSGMSNSTMSLDLGFCLGITVGWPRK